MPRPKWKAPLSEGANVVRDSAVVLLGGRTLPGNDFIHLHDKTPYIIMNGHVAAKLPCNDDSESPLNVLVGSVPNLTATNFELVSQPSDPGEVCLFHVDLESMRGGNASDIITDIALQNPTEDPIEFGPTVTVVIGINEIMKGAHEGQEGEVRKRYQQRVKDLSRNNKINSSAFFGFFSIFHNNIGLKFTPFLMKYVNAKWRIHFNALILSCVQYSTIIPSTHILLAV